MLETAIFGLLHILVFVYWLGGDLGAFYTSRFLIQSDISSERRLMAAKIVNDVDMAPRTALILAFPTGLLLALSKGWIDGPILWGWLALASSCAWIALAWHLHNTHGSSALMKRLDLGIRWVLVGLLVTLSVIGFLDQGALPLFVSLKCVLLAGAVLMGLFIRRVLTPLGPALVGLTGSNTATAEAQLAKTLNSARPCVVVIWVLILSAAFLGLWTPT